MTETTSVYEAAGGEAGMLALARAWHERVLVDEVVGHAFSHGFDPHHTERLAAYLGEALGGPPTFSTRYGDESAVVRMHTGNGGTPRWTTGRWPASTGRWTTSVSSREPARRRAARLLRLGDPGRHGRLPGLARRRPGRPEHPALVLGRARPDG